MKANKKDKPKVLYPATKSLCDEKGDPLLWELKPISSKFHEKISESCTVEVPISGKKGVYRTKIDNKLYIRKILCASVVVPDLYNKALQNSYGVASAEDLLTELIDDVGEYMALLQKVQDISGFSTLQEDIEEAKNS